MKTDMIKRSRKSFFLLLTAFFLLAAFQLSSCKNPVVPPENWPPPPEGPDTTSHDFVWQIDTLGDGNSSILNDVFIIDENNIWAVGEIYLKDSTGQIDPAAYNLVRWDGVKWNFVRIPTQSLGGIGSYPITTVFGFSENDVWTFSTAGSYSHWNGGVWSTQYLTERSGGGIRLWGTSSSNLYLVGTNGSISFFNGSSWQKIESGTTMDIRDVWGETADGETEILAVAGNSDIPLDRSILKIAGNTVQMLSDSGIVKEPLSGVWFSAGKKYWAVGSGIYHKDSLSQSLWKGAPLELTDYYSTDVSGVDTNDVVVVGAFGDLLHYNGSTWKQYPELLMNGTLFRVSIQNKAVVAVGYVGNRAIAVIGRR